MGDSKNKSYAHIHTHENVTPSITLYAKKIQNKNQIYK